MPKQQVALNVGTVTATSPAALVYSGTFVTVSLKANSANSGTVWVGDDSGTNASNGYPLAPGEIVNLDISFTGTLYVYGTGSDTLSYFGGK
jgi:hypothetical protein